jgi:outer membrane lipoprotein-sorting protein
MHCSSSCRDERRRTGVLSALALLGLLALTSLAHAQDAAPKSVDVLLAGFGKLEGLTARFVEEKQIALLKRPLRSEGTIAFAAPSSLLRRADKPEPATLLLDGEALWVADASGKRRIDLSESAIVRHFVLTFVNVLRGDRAALERAYVIAFQSTDAGWRLQLSPKLPELRKLIARATVEGRGMVVDRMTIEEDTGDVTRMTFSEVNPSARFDAAERKRVFQLAAPSGARP